MTLQIIRAANYVSIRSIFRATRLAQLLGINGCAEVAGHRGANVTWESR